MSNRKPRNRNLAAKSAQGRLVLTPEMWAAICWPTDPTVFERRACLKPVEEKPKRKARPRA